MSEAFILRDAEIKFTALPPVGVTEGSAADTLDLMLVFDDHPQRLDLTKAIDGIIAAAPESYDARRSFNGTHWACPIRTPLQERGLPDADMRGYLRTRLSRTNCPMDWGGRIVNAKENLWQGCRVHLHLNLVGFWVSVPKKDRVFMVSAYVYAARHAGGVPKRLQPLMDL